MCKYLFKDFPSCYPKNNDFSITALVTVLVLITTKDLNNSCNKKIEGCYLIDKQLLCFNCIW